MSTGGDILQCREGHTPTNYVKLIEDIALTVNPMNTLGLAAGMHYQVEEQHACGSGERPAEDFGMQFKFAKRKRKRK